MSKRSPTASTRTPPRQTRPGQRGARTPRAAQQQGRSLAGYAERLPTIDYRGAVRKVPRAAWICALVACLSAICWSVITPPFQVPDEPDHFAYVKQLAETGTLPTNGSEQTSTEEISGLIALGYYKVRQQPQDHTIATAAEQNSLEEQLKLQPKEKGSAAAGVAASQPPLYYALEAIPYSIAHSGTILDRLAWMRLLSALFAGFTALFAFMFIRETLPGERWAWTVGGLSVALVPLLGFMSGAVNPDSLLFAVTAAVFFLLARAFRRGFDKGLAVALGVATAAGMLTKVNFLGLLPGIVLGMVLLSVRAIPAQGRSTALRLLGIALGIAFAPALLYVAINLLSNHLALGLVSGAVKVEHGSVLKQLSYIWQFYLPRLPGMTNDFPGLFTTRQLWFNGYVGLYGWLDTTFPGWVYTLALFPAAALALLCARSLVAGRVLLRTRVLEMAVYAVMALGLMVLVAADSFHVFPGGEAEYGEMRYLLPLLPLLGVAIALAARGAGRRWGPVVGVLIVVLFFGHDLFSQTLEIARFYG